MTSSSLRFFALIWFAWCLASDVGAQVPQPAQYPTASEIEDFLRNGTITSKRNAGKGVTGSLRITMSHGTLTHDAHIQSVDVARNTFEAGKVTELDFKDTYRYNIAAYRLATLLWIRVPVSIDRRFENKPAAFTWWVDDVAMDESDRLKSKSRGNPVKVARELSVMRVFDELIQNKDRNQGNMLWTADWSLWLIDHTRAFRTGGALLKPERVRQIDRGLLERLRTLDRAAVQQAVGASLGKLEIDAVMTRRDRLIQHFDALIARAGEAVVLFDLDDVDPVTR